MASMLKFVDRLEAAIESGEIDLVDDVDGSTHMRFTITQWTRILMILLPEEFPQDRPEPAPTEMVPGSALKIAELAARVKRGESLHSPRDADMARGKYVSAGSGGRGRMVPQE